MPDIFISYAHQDRKWIQLLADALTNKGWSVWWDQGLRSGQNFRMSIQESLNEARCVVVAWSRYSVKSPWAMDEAERGYRRNVLVPVIVDEDVDLPLGFGGVQTTDITAWLRDSKQDASFEQLCKDIAAILSESASGSQRLPSAMVPNQLGAGAVFRRRTWLWLATIPLLSVLVFLYFKFAQRKPDVPIVDKVEYAIDDLQCEIPSNRNPISSDLAQPGYLVDLKQHLLLDKNGNPVSNVNSTDLDKLESKQLIVVHTTPQTFRVNRSHFTHVFITRDGAVKQLVAFDRAANHVNNPVWKGLTPVKNHTIAIDLENGGQLEYRDDAWHSWAGDTVPDNEVVRLKGENKSHGWHKFTDAQIRAFFEVACALRRNYPTVADIVEHSEIDAVGDPGFVFPFEELRTKLFLKKTAN